MLAVSTSVHLYDYDLMKALTLSQSAIIFALGCLLMSASQLPGSSVPANAFSEEDPYLREWILIGPFPNEETAERAEDGSNRLGFHTDFLGGEADFTPERLDAVLAGNDGVSVQTINSDRERGINFEEALGKIDMHAGYAYCLVDSPTEQTAIMGFGSDDSAKIWLNGELVYEFWTNGRSLIEDGEFIEVHLRQGLNALLVKVEDRLGGWEFKINLYTPEALAAMKERRERARYSLFAVEPVDEYSYLFSPGQFPEINWRYPGMIEKLFGPVLFTVQWYNADLEPVSKAEKPGRYLMTLTAEHPDGVPIRRAMTFYCIPQTWAIWQEEHRVDGMPLPSTRGPFDRVAWEERQEDINEWFGEAAWDSIPRTHEGAILISYLAEMEPLGRDPKPTDDPFIRHNEIQLALKLKQLGIEDEVVPLAEPGHTTVPATTLRPGTMAEAGFSPGLAEELREIGQEWAMEDEGQSGPFTLLVARNGIIVFHEPFQSPGYEEVDLETKYYVASITKSVTGLLLAQFLEQDSLQLDDPVGLYLRDFPTEGDTALTLRQCMTHRSGFDGHWGLGQGGPFNPHLDNLLLIQIASGEAVPGKKFHYNGLGHSLTGRVMEARSGKNIQRLFHENLFEPLEIEDAGIMSLGTSGMFSAKDIAKFGQLLSNKGAYGDRFFFSEDVYEQIRPPEPEGDWSTVDKEAHGIGLTWMITPPDESEEPGLYDDEPVVGHGSATASILRVGEDSGIVVAAGRTKHGKNAASYTDRIMRAVHRHALPISADET